MDTAPEVFFITGEASGDRHSAPVVRELLARGFRVTGIGGAHMRAAGAELLADSTHWGAMGVPEGLRKTPALWIRSRLLRWTLRKRRPAVVVLVDFGFFNIRMARYLKRWGGARFLYYFPPGSWRPEPRDWSGLARITDRIATPFAHNAEFLRASGADAVWVGHPAVDSIAPVGDRAAFRRGLGLPDTWPVIGVLAGSRRMERAVLGGRLIRAAELIRAELPEARFLWSPFAGLGALEERLWGRAEATGLFVRVEESHGILRGSDLVLTAMGTATLETAAALTPMVAVYDGSAVAKWIATEVLHQRREFYGMPNLLMGREVVPEVVPREWRESIGAEEIAAQALGILGDAARLKTMRDDLAQVRALLGAPDVASRVADVIAALADEGSGDIPPR